MQRALAFALAAATAAPAAAQQQEPFRVFTRTGVPAVELYAVRSPRGAENNWGRSFLNRPLWPEGNFSLRLAEGAGCRFDIRLVLVDGRVA